MRIKELIQRIFFLAALQIFETLSSFMCLLLRSFSVKLSSKNDLINSQQPLKEHKATILTSQFWTALLNSLFSVYHTHQEKKRRIWKKEEFGKICTNFNSSYNDPEAAVVVQRFKSPSPTLPTG